jgi:glycosyltransferase involved in cell wall biosynthesis
VHREKRGAYDDEIECLGGKIYRLPAISLKNLLNYKSEVRKFFRQHPEYQMIHGHCSELGYWIYKEASRQGVPFIAAHAHNAHVTFDGKYFLRTILKHLMRPYLTHYFSCGQDSSIWLFGKKLASKAIILPNAIDADSYTFNPQKREQIREIMGWNEKIIVGNVARFSPQKNHRQMLHHFKRFLELKKNSLLVLVGDKSGLYSEIKSYANDLGLVNHVQFLGSRTDVCELMQGMDVFLFPSLYEGFGIAMLEAQAAGLPVVKSHTIPRDAVVIPELVKTCHLSAESDEWAEEIINMVGIERLNTSSAIKLAGFDIHENAIRLQNFYLEHSSCLR